MIGFIGTSVTVSLNYNLYSAIADLHTFQFTVAHAQGFSVFTSRLLATDLNTETITSNHYEVLPFLVQSPWNLETQLNSVYHSLRQLTVSASEFCPFIYIQHGHASQKTHVTCSLSSQSIGALIGPTENTSRDRYPLSCYVTADTKKHCSSIIDRVCVADVA
jgi:hypothetical protein